VKPKFIVLAIMTIFFVASIGTVEATVTVKSLTRLTETPTDEWAPSWSPDGTKIAYTSNYYEESLWVMNADGSNQFSIPNTIYGSIYQDAWNPDGTKITFQKTDILGSSNKDIYTINIDGTELLKLTTDFEHEGGPAWSPDGDKIVYMKDRYFWNGGYNAWIMNVDGSDKQQITTDIYTTAHFAWSPDGTKIAFHAGTEGQIYLMNPDGSEITKLTSGEGYKSWPSWSPDGTKIAFVSETSGIHEIWIMDADGQNPIKVISSADNNHYPSWSPDGTKIAFGSDRSGSLDIWLLELNFNEAPIADAGDDQTVNEGDVVTFSGSYTDDESNSPTVSWDFGDGSTASDTVTPTHVYADNGEYTVTLTVTDDDGGVGTDTLIVTVNNVNPVLNAIISLLDPHGVNTPVAISSTFSDVGILDTHTAVWNWGDGIATAGIVAETNGAGTVTGEHAYSNAGIYWVTLTVIDNDGGSAIVTSEYCIVIYDPEGGFVTGGGWIDSPVGAYMKDSTLEGKATFGFVSKYQKGATVPTGNTEFQFKVADLNFKSTSYDWLVIAGPKAQYKGTGTINGEGNYGFMLTAVDAELTPSTDVDLFRIKIWDKATDAIVYDNEVGVSEDAAPSTVIGGGSIVIHKAK